MGDVSGIRDYGLSAIEHKISLVLDIREFTNGGYPKDLFKLIKEDHSLVEDIFASDDSLIILPSSREAAKNIYDACVYFDDEWNDGELRGVADDVSWIKMDGRYWLSLWWD